MGLGILMVRRQGKLRDKLVREMDVIHIIHGNNRSDSVSYWGNRLWSPSQGLSFEPGFTRTTTQVCRSTALSEPREKWRGNLTFEAS